MTTPGEDWRPDFLQALGETFGEYVSPPIPFEHAIAHTLARWPVGSLGEFA
jgi:hypothetical protein